MTAAAATPFSLDCLHEGAVTVLAVGGEVDMATAENLEQALDGLLRPGAAVLADLSGCRFMDASGLNALLRARLAGRDRGARLAVLATDSGPVRRVLDAAGATVFDTFESRRAGVSALAA